MVTAFFGEAVTIFNLLRLFFMHVRLAAKKYFQGNTA
jgi:hypothetical protein